MILARMRSPFCILSCCRAVYCGDFLLDGVSFPEGFSCPPRGLRVLPAGRAGWFFFVSFCISSLYGFMVGPPAQAEGTGAGGVRVVV